MAAKLKAISSEDSRHPLWRTSKRQNCGKLKKKIPQKNFQMIEIDERHKGCNLYYLSLMSDDDVFILVWRWHSFELILFQSRHSIRSEQSLVLSHTQRLAFFPGEGSILRQQLTVVFRCWLCSFSACIKTNNTELKT
jgi:hypothetical protein